MVHKAGTHGDAHASPMKMKSGIYAYRIRVPADVVDAFGQTTIKKSLGTRGPVEAKRLFNLMYGQNEAIWAQMRQSIFIDTPMG